MSLLRVELMLKNRIVCCARNFEDIEDNKMRIVLKDLQAKEQEARVFVALLDTDNTCTDLS